MTQASSGRSSRRPRGGCCDPAAAPAGAGQDAATREAAVRSAAYALYEARGRIDGHDLEDWLDAQAQIARSGCAPGLAAADDMAAS